MSKVAEDVFFSEAFSKHEKERLHWQREVLNDLLSLRLNHGITMLGNQSIDDVSNQIKLAEQLKDHTLSTGNDIFSDVIIKSFLAIENNEKVKELVSNVWVGLWDAPDIINAGINTNPFYDGSYLLRFTSDFQILLRKIVELFTTEIFAIKFTKETGDIPNIIKHMLAIELHDIRHEDNELGVKNLIDHLPDSTHQDYHTIFEHTFLAGCAFVLFHEIGHRIENDDTLAQYYEIVPSTHSDPVTDRKLMSEYNADMVSMKIIKKLYGNNEVLDWLGYAGVLLCFLTLAVREKDPTQVSDHPSLQNRYMRAKNFVINQIGAEVGQTIFFYVDTVAQLLTYITEWDTTEWWINS